jgi:MFS family permease
VPRTVVTSSFPPGQGAALLQPRADVVFEEDAGNGRFTACRGPVQGYERRVEVAEDGSATQTVEYTLNLPYFWWLFSAAFRRRVAGAPRKDVPWWAPPEPLDARAAGALDSLAAIAVVLGYLNTLFTQTIAFAGEEFGAGSSAQGVAGSIVRLGGLLALMIVAVADRRGRRRILLTVSLLGCTLAVSGALAPSLAWLTASQTAARGCATALLLLVGILAAEEVPARCRAYAVSLLAMAGGLGAGMALVALNLADLGERGWRLIYLVPVLGIPIVATVRKRLRESRRFLAPHRNVKIAGHGGRLALLAVSGFLSNIFVAPQSQFLGRYLRTEHNFSAGRISLLALVTGAPGAIGIVVGGRLADLRGRRQVATVALLGGSACTVGFFFANGWAIWAFPLVGTMLNAATVPALGVYGPELFPTSLRGRANGLIGMCALVGSAAGLALAGFLGDYFGRLGPAMAILATGPVLVAALIALAYPETAGRELEDLNPEDVPPPAFPA